MKSAEESNARNSENFDFEYQLVDCKNDFDFHSGRLWGNFITSQNGNLMNLSISNILMELYWEEME